jgi:hypothetical protein
MEFNKVNLVTIRKDIDEALKAVSEKHGIDLGISNISFNPNSFTTKLTAIVKSAANTSSVGTVDPKWRADFLKKVRASWQPFSQAGLTASSYGTEIKIVGNSGKFVIIGAQARKENVIVRKLEDGKAYTFPIERVQLVA